MTTAKSIWNEVLMFFGLRKPPELPTDLELYAEEWQYLLRKLALHRIEQQTVQNKIEATAAKIDMLEALMSAYPAQQERLAIALTNAKGN